MLSSLRCIYNSKNSEWLLWGVESLVRVFFEYKICKNDIN